MQQPKPDGTQHDASNHDERCQDLVIEAGVGDVQARQYQGEEGGGQHDAGGGT